MKYSPEKKAEALSRIAEVGIAKTCEEQHISAQTLYKWQRELKETGGVPAAGTPVQPEISDEEIRQMILNERSLEAAVARLEGENASLKQENGNLRKTVSQLKKALIAFIG